MTVSWTNRTIPSATFEDRDEPIDSFLAQQTSIMDLILLEGPGQDGDFIVLALSADYTDRTVPTATYTERTVPSTNWI
jgi:hypothetical protein